MTSRRFFSLLWRFNAVVISAVGVLGLLGLLIAAAVLVKDLTRTRHIDGVVNITEGQVEGAKTWLGDFAAIEGTAMLRAPLNLNQEYGRGYISKGASSIQNYLYLDSATHASHWLIPGNRGLILETVELPARSYRNEESAKEVFVYQLVDEDTNGDGKLSEGDQSNIAVSDPAGKRFVRVLSKVEDFNGAHLIGKDKVVLLYTSNGALRAAEVDLKLNKVVRETVLKPVGAVPTR